MLPDSDRLNVKHPDDVWFCFVVTWAKAT